MIDRDPFILNNTCMILEMLTKSFNFTSRFKNRDCVEKLITISKHPHLSSAIKQQIIRICHALSSTTSLSVLKYYDLQRFDNHRGAINDPVERKVAQSLFKRELKDGAFGLGSSNQVGSGNSFLNTMTLRSIDNLKLSQFEPRAKNFYTPVFKKELAFKDENDILKKTLAPEALRQGRTLGKSEWDTDDFYTRTVKFNRPPSPVSALSKTLHNTVQDVVRRQQAERMKASYEINPYKVTFLKDAYPALANFPPSNSPTLVIC